MNVIKAPRILLPNPTIDLSKWSVIACDQFTSEPEYWQQLSDSILDSPSSLHLIFPEVYLGKNEEDTIQKINQNMKKYLKDNLFVDAGECFVLVNRKTEFKNQRLGLVISVDLEAYDYSEKSQSLIRATEKTVISRIPPRVKIRKDALIELPHVQLLMDDRELHIIENLYEKRNQLEKIYDFELNMNGGHLKGYKISDTSSIINQLNQLIKDNMLFIVGDGNHSLATAKACWEMIKPSLNEEQKNIHPSRYAMVELINIHDEGLEFEPIHRVIFDANEDFIPGLKELAKGNSECFYYTKINGKTLLPLTENAPEAIRLVQDYIDSYLHANPNTSVDYVHGEDSLLSICKKHANAIGITLPPIDKNDIFDYVAHFGVLPRKSFSMGEASEKRYYLECRKIK